MANQERKLKNNVDTLERETASRLVNINRQGGRDRSHKTSLEALNKEYFANVRKILDVK